jgi:hypothetical protein
MGSLPQQPTELKVEQPALSKPEDVGSPAEVHGGSTIETEEDHMVDLTE